MGGVNARTLMGLGEFCKRTNEMYKGLVQGFVSYIARAPPTFIRTLDLPPPTRGRVGTRELIKVGGLGQKNGRTWYTGLIIHI